MMIRATNSAIHNTPSHSSAVILSPVPRSARQQHHEGEYCGEHYEFHHALSPNIVLNLFILFSVTGCDATLLFALL